MPVAFVYGQDPSEAPHGGASFVRARQAFETRFSPEALTRALSDLYAEMLAEAR